MSWWSNKEVQVSDWQEQEGSKSKKKVEEIPNFQDLVLLVSSFFYFFIFTSVGIEWRLRATISHDTRQHLTGKPETESGK